MTKEYQRELEEKGILPILTEEEDRALWEGLKATREKCLPLFKRVNIQQLIAFLKSEPIKFTYAEIEQMMNEEMAKPPEEMDTDFIDLCARALCEALDRIEKKS